MALKDATLLSLLHGLEILTPMGETWSQYGKQSIPLQLYCYYECWWAGTIHAWESLKIAMCWCLNLPPLLSCVAAESPREAQLQSTV